MRSGYRWCASIAGLCMALGFLMPAGAATPARQQLPAEWNELVEMFDPLMQKDHIVGGSAALVQDGRIVARHHYGFADKASGRRVDADTIFHWASITKTLNAIGMMQLRDHGMISLADPVAYLVPELRQIHNPFGSMDDITIGMLLEHSAGFQAGTWPYKQGWDWEPFEPTHWEQLVAMMPYQQIGFEPGSRFSYSNPSWIYLSRILEDKTGDPWEAYIEKNIFAPLGMTSSYFAITPYYLRQNRSHRYQARYDKSGKPEILDEGSEFDPGITVPNGGWNSPLDDVAAYIGFLTGAHGGDRALQERFDAVLSRATLEEMFQPRHPTNRERNPGEQMGLAFFISGAGEHRVIGHTGGQGNFATMMFFNPATRRGAIIAFNTVNNMEGDDNHGSFSAVYQQLLKLLR